MHNAVTRFHVVWRSVRLSVCDVVGSGSQRLESWKLIARTISPTPSLFVDQRPSTYSQGNMGKFGETRGGVENVACWSTKAAISLKGIKIEVKLLQRVYIGSHKRSFKRYHPLPPKASPFSRLGVRNPTRKLQSLLSQERLKPRTSSLADTFTGSIRTKAHERFGRKGSVGVSGDCRNFFSTPYYLRIG